MKKLLIPLFIIVCLANTHRFVELKPFDTETTLITTTLVPSLITPYKKGEKLDYKIAYGILGGGTASIQVRDESHTLEGKKLIHIVGTGQSTPFWDTFYKVRDRYETFVEEKTHAPRLFIRKVDEGGFQFTQNYKFYPEKQLVKTDQQEEFAVPNNVQDMMSAFYFARTFDFTSIKKGDIVTVQSFVDNEIFPLSIKYLGDEIVKVASKKFNCMKFAPIVQEGRVFKSEEDLTVWISNDHNKIPVKVEAKILIGAVTMELTSYSGLAN